MVFTENSSEEIPQLLSKLCQLLPRFCFLVYSSFHYSIFSMIFSGNIYAGILLHSLNLWLLNNFSFDPQIGCNTGLGIWNERTSQQELCWLFLVVWYIQMPICLKLVLSHSFVFSFFLSNSFGIVSEILMFGNFSIIGLPYFSIWTQWAHSL